MYNHLEVSEVRYEIGKRIKFYRLESGLSQKELAAELNISSSRISNWEQGINRPDADILGKLCKALGVSPSELLDIKLPSEEFTYKERMLVKSYRKNEDLQKAVDILLDLDGHNQND